ncbi:hypothetical protein AAG570_003673 [Ranatra chinensis]|uniref:Uncharacterized protein n=1 Tax=Ranatra chinensis TaxID=642074 RepID=A0ABD0Y4D3_9HEMI
MQRSGRVAFNHEAQYGVGGEKPEGMPHLSSRRDEHTITQQKFGYTTLESMLSDIPEIKLVKSGENCFVEATANGVSRHIADLVCNQKKSGVAKLKRRSSQNNSGSATRMGGPRGSPKHPSWRTGRPLRSGGSPSRAPSSVKPQEANSIKPQEAYSVKPPSSPKRKSQSEIAGSGRIVIPSTVDTSSLSPPSSGAAGQYPKVNGRGAAVQGVPQAQGSQGIGSNHVGGASGDLPYTRVKPTSPRLPQRQVLVTYKELILVM